MHWRLILEEYSPELIYVPGDTNVVADVLSRLPLTTDQEQEELPPILQNAFMAGASELNSLQEVDENHFPLTYKTIAKEQQKDSHLLQAAKADPNYSVKQFHGGGKTHALFMHNDNAMI